VQAKHAKGPAVKPKLLPLKHSKYAQENPIYVRRPPFLISYWRDKRLILENYLTRRKIAASPEVIAILDFCSEGRRMREIVQRWREHSADSLLGAVARLTKETLLQVSRAKSPPDDKKQKALGNWKAWNPAASFFHLSTKDTYADDVTPEEIAYVEQLAKLHPVPKPLKAYPVARVIRLKRGGFSGEFPRVLRERRTWREFSAKKVSRENLSTLLELSFGIQAWEDVPTIGRLAQKTSPSGGALHPCEAYVLARRVEGVAPGIYHYDAGGHRLQLLRGGMSSAEIQRYLAGQWWFRDAAFLVLLTAVFGRTQWKYDYARAYRAVLMEAGHLCQTFCLTATWLGLAPFCTIAVADTKIEKNLGVDGISESILYAMGAGHRPKEGKP
jgi:SagB-type dehydrogenase family enzyme